MRQRLDTKNLQRRQSKRKVGSELVKTSYYIASDLRLSVDRMWLLHSIPEQISLLNTSFELETLRLRAAS